MINMLVIYFIHWCLKVLGQRVNKSFLKNVQTARNYLPITTMLIVGNKMWKLFLVSGEIQVLPLLGLCQNTALGLLCNSSFGPRSNLS